MAQDVGIVWKCCDVIPRQFLRVRSLHVVVFVQKTFLWLHYFDLKRLSSIVIHQCYDWVCCVWLGIILLYSDVMDYFRKVSLLEDSKNRDILLKKRWVFHKWVWFVCVCVCVCVQCACLRECMHLCTCVFRNNFGVSSIHELQTYRFECNIIN